MSPGDLGELVKPFVFLDYFDAPSSGAPRMADYPHSGIATHTTLLQGSVDYRDSTGKSGTLSPGSVEWMQAGGGVWHGGAMVPGERVRGYSSSARTASGRSPLASARSARSFRDDLAAE
jgi:redox-sensitive bicupin YhaK (pirin superfamily)